MKDGSGAYTVFTEQGPSASQMTAAKVMDVIARLPGCAGQAADAVSAYTQVQMEDAPTLLKIPKSECPYIYIYMDTSSMTQYGKNLGQTSKTRWFLLNEICVVTHLQASCGKDSLRKFYLDLDWKKYRTGNVFLFTENKDCSYRCR